jgi:hypothetical protein
MLSLGLSEGWVDVPEMHPTEGVSHSIPIASSSRSAPPFKNLWDMCKSTHDVAHQALVMSQDTRARQNEFFASKNYPFPPPGPEMNLVPFVNYEMPPVTDEMFYGYPIPLGGYTRPTRTRTFYEDEIHEAEA